MGGLAGCGRRTGADDRELVGVNRQIRQLAVGLMVCYVVLFVTLNYWQVGRQQRAQRQRSTTPAPSAASSSSRAARSSPPTASSSPTSVENPPGSDFTYQRQYPTGDLFANITGYYTFAFGSTELERTQNAVLTGTTPEQQLRSLPGLITGSDDTRGRCA